MNVTPKVIEAVKSLLNGQTGTPQQVADLLNNANIPNPNPQGQVQNKYTMADVVALLSDASLQALGTSVNAAPFVDSIMDRDKLTIWTNILSKNTIDPADAAAILSLIATPVSDPGFKAQISWLELNFGLGTVITPEEVKDNKLNV